MPSSQIELQAILSLILEQKNLPLALKNIQLFLKQAGLSQFDTRIEEIASGYKLMKDYMLWGYQDDMRPQLYHSMLRQLYSIAFDVRVKQAVISGGYHGLAELSARHINLSDGEIQQKLEAYVQDLAMLSLEPDTVRSEKERTLRRQHQHYVASVFDTIVVSFYWNEAVHSALLQLILSPMVDSFDALTLVSAVALSGMNGFDPWRFKLLLAVWQQTEDEELRQRAFVGWALMACTDGMRLFDDAVEQMLSVLETANADDLRRQLYELQCQIFYCSSARRDNENIQKEIIPNLMKGKRLRFDRFGIEENEDSLEDILHPDKAEQEMERIEESMNRMTEMQKQGADIYFGGFSQMKRFPFFSSVSNWFVPFSKQNPEIAEVLSQLDSTKLIDAMLKGGLFCNSDKYSFSFALKSVYEQLPPKVREMMNTTDGMMLLESAEDLDKPSYKRLQYLQDLYRFFELNPYRAEFRNPFWNDHATRNSQFFLHDALPFASFYKEIISLMSFAAKRKEWGFMRELSERHRPNRQETLHLLTTDVERLQRYYRLQNTLSCHFHEYEQAHRYCRSLVIAGLVAHEESHVKAEAVAYDEETHLLKLDSESLDLGFATERDLRSYASTALRAALFEEAARAYQALFEAIGDNRYRWHHALALMNMGRVEETLSLLYPLDMEEVNIPVKRTIAWALLLRRKPDQAERYYEAILSSDAVITEDYLNAGYSKWFLNKNNEAVVLFKNWLAQQSTETISSVFGQDHRLLEDNGIGTIDRMLMEDLVGSE